MLRTCLDPSQNDSDVHLEEVVLYAADRQQSAKKQK